jgi:hypothetical protein
MRRRRVAIGAVLLTAAGSFVSSPVVAHAVALPATFYVNNDPSANCSDTTTDSANVPY